MSTTPRRHSWKTTTCGLLGIVAGAVLLADFGPLANKIAACLSSIAASAGLLFARDANVTSEQQGLKQPVPPSGLLLLFILLAPLLCLTGCTSQRDESIADSAAVIHNAAESLPPSGQRTAIMANARGIAHAAGHDLPPVSATTGTTP